MKNHLAFFSITSPSSLTEKISFVFGTYGKSARIEGGSFHLFDAAGRSICSFEPDTGLLEDNSELIFRRVDPCLKDTRPAAASLSLVAERDSKIALWVKGPSSQAQFEAARASLTFSTNQSPAERFFVPLGFSYSSPAIESEPVYKRLAIAWGLQNEWVLIAGFLFVFAFAFIHWLLGSRLNSMQAAVGVGIAAFSLTSAVSVFILPFQAPDEPDHALTMANAMNSPPLTREFEALAKLTHLERIKFHPEEKLLTEDLKAPAEVAWESHVAPTDLSRSAFSTRLWRSLTSVFSDLSGAEAVLGMRLLQSFIFALCAAWSFWILGSTLAATHALAWLVVPTIPFFAMHVSNYGPLVSFTLVFSAAVVGLVWGKKSPRIGFALGASVALLLANSRSVWAFAPAIATGVLLGLLTRTESEAFIQSLKYWAVVCLGLALFWLVATTEFLQYTLGNINSRLPAHFHEIVTLATTTPSGLPFLFVGVLTTDHLLSKLVSFRLKISKKSVNFIVAAIAVGLFFSIALPYLKPQLVLPDIETPAKLPLSEYMKKSLILAAGLFRLSDHDFYLSRSFFGGFGWLEAPLPIWTTSIILCFAMVGLSTFLLRIRKTGELSVLLRMGLVVSSLLFSVALSAKGNWDESVNLHGRYLIPFYVTLLSLCFSGYLEPLTKQAEPQQNLIEIRNSRIFQFILITAAFLHIYSVYFLFERYFG